MLTEYDYELLDARIRVLEAKLAREEAYPQRWCFMKDDDGHNYMIPVEKQGSFIVALSWSDEDADAEFCNKFDQYRIDSITGITFENPF